MPSYHRLQTMVRRHIDQMIRTRNFRARSDRFETGALYKGSKVSVERRMEAMLSVKNKWTVFKRRLLQFSATEVIVDNQHKRPLLLQKAQTQIDGRKPSKGTGPRGRESSCKERPESVQKLPHGELHESVV